MGIESSPEDRFRLMFRQGYRNIRCTGVYHAHPSET